MNYLDYQLLCLTKKETSPMVVSDESQLELSESKALE